MLDFQAYTEQTLPMHFTLSRVRLIGLVLIAVLVAYSGLLGAAKVSRNDQTVSGLTGWLIEDDHIHIELNPLSRDQVRAFYLGRGFSEQLTESIASSCVYQAVIENISESTPATEFEIDLSDWRVIALDGVEQALVSKDEWIKRWTQEGASKGSVLAFKWATFPSQQSYKLKGDYGWGMILFGGQSGESFDVRAVWHVHGEKVEQRVKGLFCAN